MVRYMDIDFRRGPYDGLRLSVTEVRRCRYPLTVRTHRGVSLYSVLPRPADWEAVFAGEFGPAESGLYSYELILTPGRGCGAEFQDAAENGEFTRASADGWAERRLRGDQPWGPGVVGPAKTTRRSPAGRTLAAASSGRSGQKPGPRCT
jgi:hypothetical protein